MMANTKNTYMLNRAGAALLSTDLLKIIQGSTIFVGDPLITRKGPSVQITIMTRQSTSSLPQGSRKCLFVNSTPITSNGQLMNATSSVGRPQLNGLEIQSKNGRRPSSLIGVGITKFRTSADNSLSLQIGAS